jgi:hypothetical protein
VVRAGPGTGELALDAAFQFHKLAGQLLIAGGSFAQANEGAHDLDIDLHGLCATQHRRKHGDTLLGEGIGTVLDICTSRQAHGL